MWPNVPQCPRCINRPYTTWLGHSTTMSVAVNWTYPGTAREINSRRGTHRHTAERRRILVAQSRRQVVCERVQHRASDSAAIFLERHRYGTYFPISAFPGPRKADSKAELQRKLD